MTQCVGSPDNTGNFCSLVTSSPATVVLIVPTMEGWLGWVGLGGRLHTQSLLLTWPFKTFGKLLVEDFLTRRMPFLTSN